MGATGDRRIDEARATEQRPTYEELAAENQRLKAREARTGGDSAGLFDGRHRVEGQ